MTVSELTMTGAFNDVAVVLGCFTETSCVTNAWVDITGKHILITGAGKRLGRALAENFLEEARLTIHYRRSSSECAQLADTANQRGRQVLPIYCDLREVAQIRPMVVDCVNHFGPIDILVCSAADFFPTSSLTCTEQEWDNLFLLNTKAQFFLAQATAEQMLPRGGVILFICDVYAQKPLKNYTPYACSKAALLMMARNLAKEWAPQIRVNAISPGPVLLPEHYTDADKLRSIDRTLLHRLGSPQDIVEAARFLINNDYITGANLVVDGGRSLL